MELKPFQRTALDTLASFLERARILANPEQAFIESWRNRDMPQTPPPCRECPPNCLILRKILSMLHGFSPSSRLFRISA